MRMHLYVKLIARFFDMSWLHATIFLNDAQLKKLEAELGWDR